MSFFSKQQKHLQEQQKEAEFAAFKKGTPANSNGALGQPHLSDKSERYVVVVLVWFSQIELVVAKLT